MKETKCTFTFTTIDNIYVTNNYQTNVIHRIFSLKNIQKIKDCLSNFHFLRFLLGLELKEHNAVDTDKEIGYCSIVWKNEKFTHT